MEDGQKSFRVDKILILICVIIIGLLGLIGWEVWGIHDNANTANPNRNHTTTGACPKIAQTTDNTSFQLPNGWHWYELRDAGLRYAYPDSWDSPTNQTNSGAQKYVTSFTVGSSGANTTVTLSPECSGFQAALSDINNGTFDTLTGSTITKAISHSQSAYSSLSHWSSDAGNQYELATFNVVSIGQIKSVKVEYNIVTDSQSCPDDRIASNDQPECINQSINDEVAKVISSLQKM